MTTTRRIVTALVGLIASLLGVVAGAPAAFAMRVDPPQGGPAVNSTAGTAAGLATWQIALIVIAAVLLVAIATAVAVRARLRSQLRPALP